MSVTINVFDKDSGSPAFVVLRVFPDEDSIALGFGIETNGDLDLTVSLADARLLGQALLDAAGLA